jgi:hypothetical protein
MLEGFPRTHPDQKGRVWIALSFLLAAAVRIGFVLAFPTIHGGDAAARLAHADTFVLGYQLPLPQLFVVLGKVMSDDPVVVRLISCFWGAILAAGLTALLALVVESRAALFGGLLLAFDPLLVHYSIVPYQEPVAYGLVAWAFYFVASSRAGLGSLLMGAACLCRYETWLFLPLFVGTSGAPRIAALAGLPVLGWVLWWRGLAPGGLYVLDLDAGANRLSRVSYLTGKVLEYETAFPLALAALALLLAMRAGERAFILFASTLALVIAIVISFGHEYPPGSGQMSERLIHLPVLVCLVLSAAALARFSERSRPAFACCLAVALVFAGRNIRFETALLRAAAKDPDLALARDVAQALGEARAPGECVTVAAPRVDPALLQAYVSKVRVSFGDVDRARVRAVELAGSSPDRDRIAAHLKARTGTVRAEPGCPLLVIVDDAQPAPASAPLVAEVRAGPRRARVLRMPR